MDSTALMIYASPLMINFDGIPDSPAYNQSIIYQRDDPIGGDVKVEGSMQLILNFLWLKIKDQ